MITEIPTSDDFLQSGTAYLNLAWDSTVELALNLDDANIDEWDTTGDVTDEYWAAAQRPLATAVTLVQQGTEFLLKARITHISPFLLIFSNPSEWPRGCHAADTAFSEFKTIDAQDLVRVHDTVTDSRLPPQFVNRFEMLRRQRNTIMHTVARHTRFTATEVFISILEIAEFLLGNKAWVLCRQSFLESAPNAIAHSPDHVSGVMAREFLKVVDLLQPAMLQRFFGFNKRQRRYLCYNCQQACSDWGLEVRTAQLQPNTPRSQNLYCFVCQEHTAVKRRSCCDTDCKGNVLDATDGTCLTCFR